MMSTILFNGRDFVGRYALLAALGVAMTPIVAAAQVESGRQVTFAKDIAPILQRSCQNCHRPGGGAPMSLLGYEEARPWARAIKLKTSNREMPPWFIEKNVGIQHFKEDPSLTDTEIALIARWVDTGAARGNPADMPPPIAFPATMVWTIGKPDLIVSSPEMTVKAVAPDWYAFLAPTPVGLTQDRFVKSVEVREIRVREQEADPKDGPGPARAAMGYSTVHHAGITTSSGRREENSVVGGADAGGFGMTHEAGQNATIYPDELGIALRADSSLNWRIHTHSFGKEVVVRLDVAFKFHPPGFTPKYVVKTAAIGGAGLAFHDLDIPAGDDNVRSDALGVVNVPTKLVSFEPHMHSGGTRMCVVVQYPTGARETLNCAAYNHNWVKVYWYEDDAAPLLPAGTFVHVIGWYDNSTKNPRVSDPRNWKGFGSRSIDDMMFFLGRFVPLTAEQFDQEVAAREAKERVNKPTAQNP